MIFTKCSTSPTDISFVKNRKPNSRYEVLQLKKTMENMLQDLEVEAGIITDMKGPTQVNVQFSFKGVKVLKVMPRNISYIHPCL